MKKNILRITTTSDDTEDVFLNDIFIGKATIDIYSEKASFKLNEKLNLVEYNSFYSRRMEGFHAEEALMGALVFAAFRFNAVDEVSVILDYKPQ